jgi:MSHA biogenesis protein MshQ
MNGASSPLKTQNYDGTLNTVPNYANAITLSDANAATVGALLPTAFLAPQFDKGMATLTTPAYSFSTAKTIPTTIKLRAVETAGDSVSSASPAIPVEGTAVIRSGRLQLGSAYGSELLDLPIPLEAQYWAAGGYYTTNREDSLSCTSINPASIMLSGFTQNLTACETQFSPTGAQTLVNGKLPLRLLRPGAGNNGSVSLTLNLGSVAAGSTCVSGTASSATAANLPWFGTNPTGRATFGLFKTPLIYRGSR